MLGTSVCFGQTKQPFTSGGINYIRETFTTSVNNWPVPPGVSSVSYLIVGGGGGGGAAYDNGGAGGGGGGQVITGTFTFSGQTTLNVTVGNGGSGGTANRLASPPEYDGSKGENSSFGTIIAEGGTGGLKSRGGGNAFGGALNKGGNGGGGGGGNATTGGNGTSPIQTSGGTGGSGTSNSISGSAVLYGNGGQGGTASSNNNGSVLAANLGHGGSGAGSAVASSVNARAGSSGIVIITYEENAVLPVTFKLFNVTAGANAINLHWQTTGEQNNSHFIIKRSKDGVNFENFANIDGKGNSSETNSYNLVDKKPNIGTNYYQLSQVDYNGKTTLLSTQSASFGAVKVNSSVYPNPFTSSVNTTFKQGIFEKAVLSDLSGKVLTIVTIEKEQTNCTFKTDKFPSGIYFIKLSGKQSAVHKVVKR